MSDAFRCHVAIENALDRDLTVRDQRLEWGLFAIEPRTIPKMLREQAFVATGKPWLPGGTEGTVEYGVEGLPGVGLKIHFAVSVTPGAFNFVTADVIGAGCRATVKNLLGDASAESVTIRVEQS
jgi:hypothetical protein